jgi:hypothetical protein
MRAPEAPTRPRARYGRARSSGSISPRSPPKVWWDDLARPALRPSRPHRRQNKWVSPLSPCSRIDAVNGSPVGRLWISYRAFFLPILRNRDPVGHNWETGRRLERICCPSKPSGSLTSALGSSSLARSRIQFTSALAPALNPAAPRLDTTLSRAVRVRPAPRLPVRQPAPPCPAAAAASRPPSHWSSCCSRWLSATSTWCDSLPSPYLRRRFNGLCALTVPDCS